MSAFLEIDHVDRIFPLADGGEYIALKNIKFKIKQGEFITLLGHSGCGKSTLLNIVAGLDQPTHGGIILQGKQITDPGPDRMVVFQNYSLLPWMSVRENIALAVDEVMKDLPKGERKGIVEHNIDLVGLRHAAHKRPYELSGGMKQRVAIARALAIRPKLLLLDEPFGALDALTRGSLQDQLMKICQENKVTCIMVTHDADEALLLSDRIVMLTNGPEAHIGQVLEVAIPRPRERLKVVNHPSYYSLRNEIVYFLNQQKKAKKAKKVVAPAVISGNGLEKINLELGFIPLIDCAPLVVAQEKGIFAKYGLTQVNLVREPGWKAISEGVATGRLDGAQMVAGMPLAMTLGAGNQTPVTTITALTLSRNGNAITLSKKLFDRGIRSIADFKQYLESDRETTHTLGMVHPASMHNLMLRYWLAAGGIHPDEDVKLTVIPPAQMVSNLKAGNIDGYCVGEPWNSRAVYENLGFVIATDLEIWPHHVEKVLGVTEAWASRYPKTHLALIRALIEACEYCDDPRYRPEVLELICREEYVGSAPEYTKLGYIDPYNRGTGETPKKIPRFNEFYIDNTNCPNRQEMLWIITQMARWGTIPFPRNWFEVIERVSRVDIFAEAAKEIDLPLPVVEPEREKIKLFDGTIFDPDHPLEYLENLPIRSDFTVQEFVFNELVASAA